jgi:hypothetical protein
MAMSTLAGNRVAGHTEARRIVGGYVWFALMVGGWIAFFSLMSFSDSTLAELYEDLRGLPLLVELLAWFLTFPFALALTVWESSWEPATRFALVVCISIVWTVMFVPRKRPVRTRPKEV